MKGALWFQQKADELERDPFAPGTLFKVHCWLVLNFFYQCWLHDLRTYYACKAWFFDKKAAFLYAYADALEAWGRYCKRAEFQKRLKRRIAEVRKGAHRG
jgi:hypothetical protein